MVFPGFSLVFHGFSMVFHGFPRVFLRAAQEPLKRERDVVLREPCHVERLRLEVVRQALGEEKERALGPQGALGPGAPGSPTLGRDTLREWYA